MALTLDATVGGSASNSYLTRASADTYFEARFGADAWTSASSTDKEKALVAATRHVDRQRFLGFKVSTAQALEFPRDCQEEALSAVPLRVLHATCEEALWVLQNAARGGRSQRQQLQSDGVRSFSVGDMREDYGTGGFQGLCPDAASLLASWIDRTGRILSDREQAAERVWWPFT